MKLLHLVSSSILALTLLAPARAQCLVPDGLDAPGAACFGAVANLPQRGFTQQALGICWKDCGVDAQGNYTALWGALNPVNVININPPLSSCAWYRARLRIFGGNGLEWDGQMHFTYSRTWMEANTAGQLVQVWRYLVNGDLRRVSANPVPCGFPPCAPAFSQLVRYTGYVDYAYDCGTTLTERAWMITHACDAIDHAPGFPRAGAFHPDRYYTFVGPAAGFVPGVGGTLEAGGSTLEAVRRWDALALPARCTMEEQLLSGSIMPSAMTCMCGVGPANWYEGQMFVSGVAGTTISPFLSSDPFRSFPVGMWTNPAAYPGVEELRWNCNEVQWADCVSTVRQEYHFGVTTAGGWQPFSLNASTPSQPLPTTFVDQANSMLLPNNVPTRNRTYKSDHVINLNL